MTKTEPKSFKDVIGNFQSTLFGRQKYVKNEFQAYGLELAKELHDWQNRSLYIRLAKQVDRQLLDTARYFVKDHIPGAVKSPKKLFMWKLKSLKTAV